VQPTPAIIEALAHHQAITVKAGDKIGSAQDIHIAYPANVQQHVHVTVKDVEGHFVYPKGKYYLIMRHGEPNQKLPIPEAAK
jgi:hypothetical protein